jgi:hypothetical protein
MAARLVTSGGGWELMIIKHSAHCFFLEKLRSADAKCQTHAARSPASAFAVFIG